MDYYALLGIKKGASTDEIKKAYRAAAKKHHPDLVRDESKKEEAKKKFQEIQAAYDVLSDEKKRQMYDSLGHDNFTRQGSGQGGFDGFGQGGFGQGGFEDIFNDLFGRGGFSGFSSAGFGGFQEAEHTRAMRGEDLRYFVELTLEEAFSGKELKIQLPRMIACTSCSGKGLDPNSKPEKCSACKGSGHTVVQQMFFSIQQTCRSCNGRGVKQDTCKQCRGNCRINEKSTIDITIPKGVVDGVNLRMQRQGNAGIEGGPAGDLFIAVKVKKHELFAVENASLVCITPVSLPLAVLGGLLQVPTIDGDLIDVKIPASSVHGDRIKVPGKGMPILNPTRKDTQRGDMFVLIDLDVPNSLSGKEKEAWKVLLEAENSPKYKKFAGKLKGYKK